MNESLWLPGCIDRHAINALKNRKYNVMQIRRMGETYTRIDPHRHLQDKDVRMTVFLLVIAFRLAWIDPYIPVSNPNALLVVLAISLVISAIVAELIIATRRIMTGKID